MRRSPAPALHALKLTSCGWCVNVNAYIWNKINALCAYLCNNIECFTVGRPFESVFDSTTSYGTHEGLAWTAGRPRVTERMKIDEKRCKRKCGMPREGNRNQRESRRVQIKRANKSAQTLVGRAVGGSTIAYGMDFLTRRLNDYLPAKSLHSGPRPVLIDGPSGLESKLWFGCPPCLVSIASKTLTQQ